MHVQACSVVGTNGAASANIDVLDQPIARTRQQTLASRGKLHRAHAEHEQGGQGQDPARPAGCRQGRRLSNSDKN